jgi:hypothetical protein
MRGVNSVGPHQSHDFLHTAALLVVFFCALPQKTGVIEILSVLIRSHGCLIKWQ